MPTDGHSGKALKICYVCGYWHDPPGLTHAPKKWFVLALDMASVPGPLTVGLQPSVFAIFFGGMSHKITSPAG